MTFNEDIKNVPSFSADIQPYSTNENNRNVPILSMYLFTKRSKEIGLKVSFPWGLQFYISLNLYSSVLFFILIGPLYQSTTFVQEAINFNLINQ